MRRVFLSYRRADAGSYTGHLYRDLVLGLGKRRVFRDREGIEGGGDFPAILQKEIERADAVLAVIGPDWLVTAEGTERPRIFDEKDWVRRELEIAIEQGKQLIPVLVGGAQMPRSSEIPESLHPLRSLNALSVRDAPDWMEDLVPLFEVLVGRPAAERAMAAVRSEPRHDPKPYIAWVPVVPALLQNPETSWPYNLAAVLAAIALAGYALWDLRTPGRKGHWVAWGALVAATVLGVVAVYVRYV